MNKIFAILFAFGTAGVLAVRTGADASPAVRTDNWCTDSSPGTTRRIALLKAMNASVVHADSFRRDKGLLPTVPDSEITAVTDTVICRRAAEVRRRAYNGADTGALRSIILARWGATRLVGNALDGYSLPSFDWIVFDTSLAVIAVVPE